MMQLTNANNMTGVCRNESSHKLVAALKGNR